MPIKYAPMNQAWLADPAKTNMNNFQVFSAVASIKMSLASSSNQRNPYSMMSFRRFRDRIEAGENLAASLEKHKDQAAVVYALPRGGVILGAIVAEYLDAPLDLTIPRKVGHPSSPETAVCAVSEAGYRLCNELIDSVSEEWLKVATDRETAEAKRRRQVYLGDKTSPAVQGKLAVIVDDGIATGLTMRAAIHDIKEFKPARLVVAVPVAPSDTVKQISAEVDEFVVLSVVPAGFFGAVGAYYKNFDQVSDEEVIQLLRQTQK